MTKDELIAKFNQFLTQYNNTFVEAEDNTNKFQCFDLVFKWVDALNIDRAAIRHLNAYQIYEEPNDWTVQYFDLIPNTPSAVPQCGDIVVWNKNYNGGAGHVGMATGNGTTDDFECFAQNDPLGTNAHVKRYNYAYIDGFLRVKITPPISTSNSLFEWTDQTHVPLGGTWGEPELQAVRSLVNDQANDILGLEKDKENLNTALGDLQIKLAEAVKELQNTPSPAPVTDLSQIPLSTLFKELLKRLTGS